MSKTHGIESVLYTQAEIAAKVMELGQRITEDYKDKELLLVGILKGSIVFMSDLMREIDMQVSIDTMALSSYGAQSNTSGVVRMLKDLDKPCKNKHLLIVEDILDTGLTMQYLVENLKLREAASIKICCLLDKPSRRKAPIQADYTGFSIPDAFVVGYGMDYAESYRNLKDICILSPSVYGG